MIVVTGDTHGILDYKKIKELNNKKILGKNDYLIIAGDFGCIWDKENLEKNLALYTIFPFTVLFIDGNHENFDILNSYPISIWNNGKVHKIKDNIIHLMRGQVFIIENKTIFTFGGGTSIDKLDRIEHISWWKEEIPTDEEFEEGKANLLKCYNTVDYIITHSIDTKALKDPLIYLCANKSKPYKDNKILDYFEENIKYKHWYFGHYHVDGEINEKKTALFNSFYLLE